MTRPPSIVRYEQLYIASVIIGLIVGSATFGARVALLAANPAVAGHGTMLVAATMALGLLISAILWWYTARQPGVVAKWVVVVFAAFGAIGILIGLPSLGGSGPLPVWAVVAGMVTNILYIVAAALLFKPDAKLWFGEDPTLEDEA